jgi:hypothetical protein
MYKNISSNIYLHDETPIAEFTTKRLALQSKAKFLYLCSYRYYLNDQDVVLDSELKNFTKQLSADGTGPNGGIGMVMRK